MNRSFFLVEEYFDITEFPYRDIFNDVNNVWEVFNKLETFIHSLFDRGIVKANYKDKKDIYIGEGTKIQSGVEIAGPAIIGNNCFIGHASLIRDYCLIGNNVHIGHAAELKRSIFLNNSAAAHLNYVGNSIIGNNVNLSGGSILANFRLDKKSILIKAKDQLIDSGMKKLGSIIGDNSNIGVNAVLNPGTVLGKNTVVYPLQLVKGVFQKDSIIK